MLTIKYSKSFLDVGLLPIPKRNITYVCTLLTVIAAHIEVITGHHVVDLICLCLCVHLYVKYTCNAIPQIMCVSANILLVVCSICVYC